MSGTGAGAGGGCGSGSGGTGTGTAGATSGGAGTDGCGFAASRTGSGSGCGGNGDGSRACSVSGNCRVAFIGTLESGTLEKTDMSLLGDAFRGVIVIARLAFADGLSGLTYWYTT
jgi:hypothetical protein